MVTVCVEVCVLVRVVTRVLVCVDIWVEVEVTLVGDERRYPVDAANITVRTTKMVAISL